MGLLYRVGVLHQEFIAAIREITYAELDRKLNASRGRIDEFKWMVVGLVCKFEVGFRRHSPEAVAILAGVSKLPTEFPYSISKSSLEALMLHGIGNLGPLVNNLAGQQS